MTDTTAPAAVDVELATLGAETQLVYAASHDHTPPSRGPARVESDREQRFDRVSISFNGATFWLAITAANYLRYQLTEYQVIDETVTARQAPHGKSASVRLLTVGGPTVTVFLQGEFAHVKGETPIPGVTHEHFDVDRFAFHVALVDALNHQHCERLYRATPPQPA